MAETAVPFGWCLPGGHHPDCIKEYNQWYHGTKRVGRKNVAAIIITDEMVCCPCNCHKEIPVKKRTTRKRKK